MRNKRVVHAVFITESISEAESIQKKQLSTNEYRERGRIGIIRGLVFKA